MGQVRSDLRRPRRRKGRLTLGMIKYQSVPEITIHAMAGD